MNWEEIQKKREIYMEILKDFLEHRQERIKLSDGYSKVTKEYFEKYVDRRIAFPYNPKFVFTEKIEARIGDPLGDAMGVVNVGMRGKYETEYLCGLSFECVYCRKRIQLIQHEVNLVWAINTITISIIPEVICPHCNKKFEISRSGVTE